jgi:hypothetical protein
MPFQEAEKLALERALHAARELESWNRSFANTAKWLEDGEFVRTPVERNENDAAVQRLRSVYLTLWHRRGLVGL